MSSVGGAPSVGSFWVKSVTAVARSQTSSSSRPSTRMSPLDSLSAVACLRAPPEVCARAPVTDTSTRHMGKK